MQGNDHRDLGAVTGARAASLPPSAEVTTGLRKLLEAKDCFVRAAVTARKDGAL